MIHLGQIEVGGENSLEKEVLLESRGGPWGLGGIKAGAGVGAHETYRDHRKACVKAWDREGLKDVARKAEEVVWFWDKSLK